MGTLTTICMSSSPCSTPVICWISAPLIHVQVEHVAKVKHETPEWRCIREIENEAEHGNFGEVQFVGEVNHVHWT